MSLKVDSHDITLKLCREAMSSVPDSKRLRGTLARGISSPTPYSSHAGPGRQATSISTLLKTGHRPDGETARPCYEDS